MKQFVLLKTAENDEQRFQILSDINTIVKKQKIMQLVSTAMFRISYFLMLFTCAFGYCYLGMQDEEDKVIIQKFPGFVQGILTASGNFMYSVTRWRLGSLPEWVTYVCTAIIAVMVVPALLSLIAKLIVSFLNIRDDGPEEKTVRGCFEYTYNKLKFDFDEFLYNHSSWLPNLIVLLLFTTFIIVGITYSGPINWTIIFAVICAALLFFALQLIAVVPKMLSALGGGVGNRYSQCKELEKIWAEVDPEKKKELEERERIAREESKRREREAAKRASQSSGYSSGSSYGKATLVIDASNASSANEITVYLDGKQLCHVSGGRVKSVPVPTGRHSISATVYNDASETAYSLDEQTGYFEANEEYTVNYG